MAQQMEVSSEAGYLGSRLVWVLNRDEKEYKGTFQGIKIVIPPDLQKVPKHVRDGGNLMGYLDARHFITDLKEPQGFQEMPNGDRLPIFGPKALFSKDLTEEEFKKYVGKTDAQVKKELAADERRMSKKLTQELNKIPKKVAVGDDD